MTDSSERFPLFARLLHWTMAAAILAMLFIGVGMVSTVSGTYHALLGFHRPLGICILVLAAIRLLYRTRYRAPPLPDDLPASQRIAAYASHVLLYVLMFLQPLVGWGMLSAGGYPVVLFGGVALPPILPHSDVIYAWLRPAHTVIGYAFFALVVLHLCAALFHALVRRDDVLQSMAGFGRRIVRRP